LCAVALVALMFVHEPVGLFLFSAAFGLNYIATVSSQFATSHARAPNQFPLSDSPQVPHLNWFEVREHVLEFGQVGRRLVPAG
jgi:hypothetical protein